MPNARPILAIFLLCFLGSFVELAGQSSSERARNELQLGVDEHKAGNYDKAIQHFQLALTADPEFRTAQLYLATELANKCLPGVKTDENDVYCSNSISLFRQILDRYPDDLAALKSIAAVYFNQAKLDEAKQNQQKVLDADPSDPDAAYFIAIIDWTQSWKRLVNAKEQAKLAASDPFIAQPACQALWTANLGPVEEGIKDAEYCHRIASGL